MKLIKKFEYLFWATMQWPQADTSCPFCHSSSTAFVYRKYLVTSLRQCSRCHLMFRVPKSNPRRDGNFYEHRYEEGFTTDCPDEQELANLKQTSYKGTEKDYASYIEVLRDAGLESGDTIFDFGCSWGYGSWQLAQAGFRVFSYELSQSRARYAEEKLDCRMVPAPTECLERVDCFFSAHVIEHLSNPGHLWEIAASILKPEG